MCVLLAIALILGRAIHPTALLLPLLLIPQLLATVGLGWLMASLGVFIRDMPQINQLALITWMYLTPIFYSENISLRAGLFRLRLLVVSKDEEGLR